MSAREDLTRFKAILDDVLDGYCESCRMVPCVCVRRPRTRDDGPRTTHPSRTPAR